VPYVRFILPGLLVMTVAGQAFANNSTSLFQAKNEGYIDDVLTSPLRARQLVVAYMAGGLLRGWLSALTLALIASPFAGAPQQPVLLVAVLILTGLVFGALGVITGSGPTRSTSTRSSPMS
jgi:ABC-2 type transport system permease protein